MDIQSISSVIQGQCGFTAVPLQQPVNSDRGACGVEKPALPATSHTQIYLAIFAFFMCHFLHWDIFVFICDASPTEACLLGARGHQIKNASVLLSTQNDKKTA